ncbi:hypothetical protein B4U84_08565 [Westiellopsis prolifica IICB1]|nr:hypothetical protein B4U84_08565 [Westiellopsis prolifica IICB1]
MGIGDRGSGIGEGRGPLWGTRGPHSPKGVGIRGEGVTGIGDTLARLHWWWIFLYPCCLMLGVCCLKPGVSCFKLVSHRKIPQPLHENMTSPILAIRFG